MSTVNKMRRCISFLEKLKVNLKRRPIFVFLYLYLVRIRNGYKLYRSIVSKYGDSTTIYIEHYPGTGDIYITCALLESYVKHIGGNANYVVTIIGKGSLKIADLLGINNTILLTQAESDDLLTFYRFMGPELLDNIKVLHYSPIRIHTSILDQMASFNGLDFMTMYLSTVFQGMTWQDAKKFPACKNPPKIKEYFDEKGLDPQKTIILFPYANTIQPIHIDIWERLARNLREDGYMVCTNVEPGGLAIPGTVSVFVPYEDLIPFVERCGCVIGLRSGIFDIIADANCNKVVLYPTPNFYKFGVGSIFDYFSLINMGIAKRTYEFEFERVNERYTFRQIYYLIHDLMSGNSPDFPKSSKYYLQISSDIQSLCE